MRVNEYKFPTGIHILDTKYNYPGTKNNNLFYYFNEQLDYVLAHYFIESESIKHNIDKFLSNLLIKPITKKLSYYYINVKESSM